MLSQIGTNTTYLRLLLNNGNLKSLYFPSVIVDPLQFFQYARAGVPPPILILFHSCHYNIVDENAAIFMQFLISSVFIHSRLIVMNKALFQTYPTQIATLPDSRWDPKYEMKHISWQAMIF